MNSRSLSTIAVIGLVLLGALSMVMRYHKRQEAAVARQDTRWELTYDVAFEAETTPTDPDSQPTKVRLAMPFNTPHCEVLSEQWTNAGLKDKVVVGSVTRTREILLETTQPGTFDAHADFVLRLTPRADYRREPGLESLSRDERTLFLKQDQTRDIPTQDPKVKEAVQSLVADAKTDWDEIENAFNYCMAIRNNPEGTGGVIGALTNKNNTPLVRARTMVTICRAMDHPARLVTGFEIKHESNATPRVWVEVFYNQRWVPFDTEFGYTQTLPTDYVPVRRGGDSVIDSVEANINRQAYSIKRLPADPRVSQAEVPHPRHVFNLERLPKEMHQMMSLLLLLPFGALITAIMRNVIGIQTFGTFAPALLAMSFIFADWESALAILLVVMAAGLTGRVFLERLRLLMVPRLSIILTTVILCVVLGVSLLDYMQLTPKPEAVLLPLVILTIMIERFYATTEEDGWMFAVQLAIGTLVVAALCFLVLRWAAIGQLILIYPETHLITIAAFILLGRYAGYRLTELWRFRDLVEPSEPVR